MLLNIYVKELRRLKITMTDAKASISKIKFPKRCLCLQNILIASPAPGTRQDLACPQVRSHVRLI